MANSENEADFDESQAEDVRDGSDLDADSDAGNGGLPIAAMSELLRYLNEERGFDFAGYKQVGLARRLSKRLHALKLASYADYVDYLQVHPDEFVNLFNVILINATNFFRDPIVWEYVQQEIVPQILASKPENGPIRLWSAGCATGQEAYTAAMVLADALGIETFTRRVKIYATDVDDDALSTARQAAYTPKEVAAVPPAHQQKYFERNGLRLTFHKELRRSVIFGRHNLFHDAPISKIDLLLCRNTLMYFNADAQARILSSLHFALNPAGMLVLGKAEMLLTHSALFSPLDLKRRVFTKVTHNYPRPRASFNVTANRVEDAAQLQVEQTKMRLASFEASPIAQLAVDAQTTLVAANDQARRVFGMTASELGQPLHELTVHRKLEGLLEHVQEALLNRRVVQLPAVEWARSNEAASFFDIVVNPLMDPDGALHGTQISLLDVTAPKRMQEELQQTTQELEAAYEELQSTSEELETTNEELQSTVEELETTNEELQSTNEELETTNEELHSTNEELQGMNEELRVRTSELGRLNSHFESILASMRSAVVVLDLDMHVQVWSDRAQDLWGLRADEVRGKHFLNFDIGLPLEQLSPAIRACISGERAYSETTLAATNRRGKPFECTVRLTQLLQGSATAGVIILMDENTPGAAA